MGVTERMEAVGDAIQSEAGGATGSLKASGDVHAEASSVVGDSSAVHRDVGEPASRAIRRRDSIFRRSLAIADMLAVGIALTVSAAVLGGVGLATGALAVPVFFVLVAKAIGLYDRDAHLLHRTTLDELPRLFGLATLSTLLLWIADGLVVNGSLGRGEILSTWLLLFVLLIALRSVARHVARAASPVERCIFVGDAGSAVEFAEKLASSHSVKAEMIGWLPVTGRRKDDAFPLERLLQSIQELTAERQVQRVVLGPGVAQELLDSIRELKGNGVKVSLLPDVSRVVSTSVELDRLNGLALMGVRRFEITASSRFIKRAFDIVGSVLALLFFSPLLLAIAIAIKLDSRGPILFRQQRAGRHGRAFEMLKFRSMVDGADEHQEELRHLNEAEGVFKIANDPRVTRVGRIIRKLHVDELPQLVNVLRGEMSLVGPRPLPLHEDKLIEGWHRRRLDLRPGITGPWQALGSSRIPVREMVRLDYQYVANWSLWNDMRILILTVGQVARGRGL
jgi:exopolysaccharide biosynthesis polyprenyl glycosylphosphotransferase